MLEIQDRALILKGPFNDLSDVLRIARHQGKKIFKCKKVRVDPFISYVGSNDLIVMVRPEKGEYEENFFKIKV